MNRLEMTNDASASCPVTIIPATLPKNRRSRPLPGTASSAVSSINYMCLILRSLSFGALRLAGSKLPSRLIQRSMNVAISVEILQLVSPFASINCYPNTNNMMSKIVH